MALHLCAAALDLNEAPSEAEEWGSLLEMLCSELLWGMHACSVRWQGPLQGISCSAREQDIPVGARIPQHCSAHSCVGKGPCRGFQPESSTSW